MSHGHEELFEDPLFGISAEFDDPDLLMEACHKAYAEGYRDMDAYSPYPIHGLAESIGYKKSPLPAIVLGGGLMGALGGFMLQYGTTLAYPHNVGGRPHFSWPSFIPVTFEVGVLTAALCALVGMLVINGLPQPYHPMFNAKNFEYASRDRYFLCIEATDQQFDAGGTADFLRTLGATDVSEVMK